MNEKVAFQDQIPNNHCFGCGPNNSQGLQIKSYWVNENESICHFIPSPHHSAGPTKLLNGGIISTIIDCHSVCTAIAKGYQLAGRDIGIGETIWFATGKLEIAFNRPVVIDKEVTLNASIVMAKEKNISLICKLSSEGKVCAESNVIAVRVPNAWFE
jgi:acyl-coenzyme A thioesterase PaaI-like protein